MKNSLKASAIISYVAMGVNLLTNMFFIPILIRQLGQSEYGIYNVCVSAISYLNLFQLGFGATYLRYFIKFESEENKQKTEELNGMFFLVFTVIAGLVLIAGVFLVRNIEDVLGRNITASEYVLARNLLSFMVLNVSITMLSTIYSSLITAHEKFFFQKSIELATTLLKPMLLIPLLFLGYKSVVVVAVTTGLTLANFVVCIWFCLAKLKIKFRFSNFDFRLFREMGGFTFFIFMQGIMDIFNWQIGKFLIARLWGADKTAIYSVGAQFNTIFITACSTMTVLFVPRVNRIVAQKQEDSLLSDLLIRMGRIQFFVVAFIMLLFIFLGQSVVHFFAGSGYENAYYVGILLMLPLVGALSMELGFHIMRAKAKHKWQMVINAGMAFVSFLISIPLCKAYGEIGAAAGTFIGMVLANNIIQYIYYQKVGKLDMKRWLKEIATIFPALILPCIAGIIVFVFVNTNQILYFMTSTFVFAAIYAVSLWFFGMNTEEKVMIINPVKKILCKLRGRGA